MPNNAESYKQRIARLKSDMVNQGQRVEQMIDRAVEAVFDRDESKAAWVIENDAIIDKVDVDIERAAVELLADIARTSTNLGPDQLRWILTIVKVNNELERIADEAVNIAERAGAFISLPQAPPDRFHVMANSVIAIVRDANKTFDLVDSNFAKIVLASDDTIDAFEEAILREMQQELREGKVEVDFAFAVNQMAASLERVGDHCTNIAEQTIYAATGDIVRHTSAGWTAPEQPR